MRGHTALYEEFMRHGVQPRSLNCLCGHRFFARPSPLDQAEHESATNRGRLCGLVQRS